MNREDFPMLEKEYIYFNNASTAYKSKKVIDSIVDYYNNYSVNINRGIDSLGYSVTEKYEGTRKKVANLLNVKKSEIVFTRGTTDSINLATSYLESILEEGDEVLVSNEEHHAIFVTMQQLCIRKKIIFRVVDFEDLVNNINEKTKVVATSHITNVLGKRSEIEKISNMKEKFNFLFLLDGAQGIVHENLDLEKLSIDFYAFSGHKLYGPMGVGVLYSKHFDKMSPITFGGEMVDIVDTYETTFKKAPYKFEAGTMMVPEVIALGEAIDYILSIGYEKINSHIFELRKYLIEEMKKIEGLNIYNEEQIKSNLITFNFKGLHSHDIATFLDKNKIIVRAGHHCAAPLMKKLNEPSTIRISLGLYNTLDECQKLVNVLKNKEGYLDVIF